MRSLALFVEVQVEMGVIERMLPPEQRVVGHVKRIRGRWVSADTNCDQDGGTRNKMKKTTRILPLVFSVLLFLGFVTASARARSNPDPAPRAKSTDKSAGAKSWA